MKRSGFTLAEVMVAISIIAVLAGIAIPVSRSMIERANESVCLQNLGAIGAGLQGYLRDNGDRMPVMQAARKSKSDEAPVMDVVLIEYLGNSGIFHCPSGTKEFRKTGSSYLWNSTQNGRLMSELSFFGIRNSPELIPIVSDKESWHRDQTNFLYADSSTSNQIRFGTAKR